jgi:hypothetical protein
MTKRDDSDFSDAMEIVEPLIVDIREKLDGQPQGIQAMILSEMVAWWLAGHEPGAREAALLKFFEITRDILPVILDELYGPGDELPEDTVKH